MKNVLLTTTVLVAFAGVASAGSHTGISWGGDASLSFNTFDDFESEANLTLTGTAELNNGVTAGLSYGIGLGDENNHSGVDGEDWVVLTLESAYGKLSAGDADEIGAASDHFGATDGVGDFDDADYEDTDSYEIRADASYSGIDISVSEIVLNNPSDLRVGVSGMVSSFEFGLGYDSNNGDVGVNVGTEFGAFSVDGSYFTDTVAGAATYGVAVGYDMGNGIDLGAYYASTGDYGVSAGYEAGAITADLAYDVAGGAGSFTVDGTYDLGSGLMALAGYDSADSAFYVGATYDLGSGAEAYVAYSSGADGSEVGPNDRNGGTTVGVSLEF